MKQKGTLVRWLLFLLAAALLTGSLWGCNGKKDDPAADTETDEGGNTGTTDDGYEPDDLPSDLDFDDQPVNILYWQDCPSVEFDVQGESGEPVSDAVYSRNEVVRTRLGIVFKWIPIDGWWSNESNFITTVRQSVNGNMNSYHIIATYSQSAAAIANNDLVMNLAGLPYLNLSKPWWPSSLTESFTIRENLFFLSGDISSSLLNEMNGVFFNPALLSDDMGAADLYAMVDDNEWTLDRLMELAETVYVDRGMEGQKDAEDTYGIICPTTTVDAFLYGSGILTVEKNDKGNLIVGADYVGQKADDLSQKLKLMLHTRNSGVMAKTGQESEFTAANFAAGNALFLISNPGAVIPAVQNVRMSYGVLPIPKYDSAQESYLTVASNTISLYTVAADCDEATARRAAAVLECMGSEGYRKITPVLFEECMKLRYSHDPDSRRMYDLIRSGVVFDIGRVFGRQMGDIAQTSFRGNVELNSTSWLIDCEQIGPVLESYLDRMNRKFK